MRHYVHGQRCSRGKEGPRGYPAYPRDLYAICEGSRLTPLLKLPFAGIVTKWIVRQM